MVMPMKTSRIMPELTAVTADAPACAAVDSTVGTERQTFNPQIQRLTAARRRPGPVPGPAGDSWDGEGYIVALGERSGATSRAWRRLSVVREGELCDQFGSGCDTW